MARGDNRRTLKFQQRRGQAKLKARIKRAAAATKAARAGKKTSGGAATKART